MTNPNQPPLPLPEFQPPKRPAVDVDEWTRKVAADAPNNPYLSQENRVRRYAGLDPIPADLSRRAMDGTVEVEPVNQVEQTAAGTTLENPVEAVRRTLREHKPDWYKEPPQLPDDLDRIIERRRRQIIRQMGRSAITLRLKRV